jgi:hypothetical protein
LKARIPRAILVEKINIEQTEHRTSVRTWLWFVVVRDIEALPGKA